MSKYIMKMDDIYRKVQGFTAEQQRQFGILSLILLKTLYTNESVNEKNIVEHYEILIEAIESLKEDKANE